MTQPLALLAAAPAFPRCPGCGIEMSYHGRAQCSGEAGVMGIDYFRCDRCGEQDTVLLTGKERTLCPVYRFSTPATDDGEPESPGFAKPHPGLNSDALPGLEAVRRSLTQVHERSSPGRASQ